MKITSVMGPAYISALLTVLPLALLIMWILPFLVIPTALLAAIPLGFVVLIFSLSVDDQFWAAPRPSLFGALFGGICCLLLFLINPPRANDGYFRSMAEFSIAGVYLGGASLTWMNVFIRKRKEGA